MRGVPNYSSKEREWEREKSVKGEIIKRWWFAAGGC
jgi:hypothetical protein